MEEKKRKRENGKRMDHQWFESAIGSLGFREKNPILDAEASNYRIVLFARMGTFTRERAYRALLTDHQSRLFAAENRQSTLFSRHCRRLSAHGFPLRRIVFRLSQAGRFYVKSFFRARQPRHRDVAVLGHRRRRESIINAERSLARLAANDQSSSPSM